MSVLRKNWKAIAAVPCELTRAALCYTEEPALMEKFARGFPECFYESEHEARMPFSTILLNAAEKLFEDDWEECKEQTPIAEIFREVGLLWMYHYEFASQLPIIGSWNWPDYESYEQEVPEEVVQQIRGKKFRWPFFVTYKQQKCVIGYIWGPYRYWLHESWKILPRTLDGELRLVLVSANCIEFDVSSA